MAFQAQQAATEQQKTLAFVEAVGRGVSPRFEHRQGLSEVPVLEPLLKLG